MNADAQQDPELECKFPIAPLELINDFRFMMLEGIIKVDERFKDKEAKRVAEETEVKEVDLEHVDANGADGKEAIEVEKQNVEKKEEVKVASED